jgi:3-isopropylmalate/(R)-2-methylmalate dehydratase large subunit
VTHDARTLFDKVWTAHEVVPETADTPAVLYIDLHLIHEVTSPQAFSVLKALGLAGAPPDRTLATMDHSTPTSSDQVFGKVPIKVDAAAKQVRQLEQNAAEFGVELFGMRDARRGIVHVISPELGATQPGMTIVCGDSHTSTHGAFGALAFGIGTTEVGHVFATQACCSASRRPSPSTSTASCARRHRQGPDPRHHRQDRRLRRHRPCVRISRLDHPRAVDG